MIFKPAILYIDDEAANLSTFKRAFQTDYLVKTCRSGQEALNIIAEEHFPLIIADQKMPGMTGIELCERLITVSPQSLRMILTAYTETDLLLNAINKGHVHDYIVKPWRKSELKPVIEKAFENYKIRANRIAELTAKTSQVSTLKQDLNKIYEVDNIIGSDKGLNHVMTAIDKVSPTDSTVLLLGETGTGKEVLARHIHAKSQRSNQAFVAVHCAAFAKSVLESELFGHEKGAFTGADEQRIGCLESAHQGTIFLDELSEIPQDIQVKLLRVLQEREIQRVGSNKPRAIDVRIIGASNRDLQQAVQAGTFREDLYYRLNVVPINIPPLRERKEDISTLADYFVTKFCTQIGRQLSLSEAALTHLKKYDWPGNIRELQNVIERAVILSPDTTIDIDDLNSNIEQVLETEQVDITHLENPMNIRQQIQQEQITQLSQALKVANGNIAAAARHMGIARSTLFHRLKKYGLI